MARQGPVQVGEKSDCKTKYTDELKVKSSPFHTLESLSLAREPKLGCWQASVRLRDKVQSMLGSLAAVASPAPQSLEASRAGEQGFEAWPGSKAKARKVNSKEQQRPHTQPNHHLLLTAPQDYVIRAHAHTTKPNRQHVECT